jgi:hypothetical protein
MTPEERAARERKQKIFVVAGGLFLVALLAIQLPRVLGGGGSSAAATTNVTDTVAADPSTTAPVTTPATTTRAPAGLADTDRPFRAGPGQLSSFNAFSGKDPFVQQVSFDDGVGAASEPSGTGDESGGDKKESKPASKQFTVGGKPAAAVTVVSVNGTRQALVPGAAFPAFDPVFVLVSEQPQAKSVTIAVAGGAYASGSKATRLRMGKPLVLVNTTTGARYKLVLVSVGNGEAAATTDEGSTPSSGGSKQKQPTSSP